MKNFKLYRYLFEKDDETKEIPISDENEEVYNSPGDENQPPDSYQNTNPSMAGQNPAMGDPSQQQIDPVTGMPVDPYGMPIEEPLSPEEIGKVYMLLKLHSRLDAMNRILAKLPDDKYNDVKLAIAEALELFRVVVSNYDSFKGEDGKLDNIIKKYRSFVSDVTDKIENIGD
jgi:hypothetical protein